MLCLKEYILKFQSSEPNIHNLHTSMVNLLRDFLGSFVKPEVF